MMWEPVIAVGSALAGFALGYWIGRAERKTKLRVAQILAQQIAQAQARERKATLLRATRAIADEANGEDRVCTHGDSARNRDGDCVACAFDDHTVPCGKCGAPVYFPAEEPLPPPGIVIVCTSCIGGAGEAPQA